MEGAATNAANSANMKNLFTSKDRPENEKKLLDDNYFLASAFLRAASLEAVLEQAFWQSALASLDLSQAALLLSQAAALSLLQGTLPSSANEEETMATSESAISRFFIVGRVIQGDAEVRNPNFVVHGPECARDGHSKIRYFTMSKRLSAQVRLYTAAPGRGLPPKEPLAIDY